MERRNFITAGIASSLVLTNTSEMFAQSEDNPKPFYVAPKGSLLPGPGNMDIRTLVKAEKTNLQFSSIEAAIGPKQMGPSPHLHEALDELMYVTEGTATVLIGQEIYEVKAGGWIFRPRKIVHSFWNATNEPIKFIDCFFNQPFEDYLETLFHKIIPEMIANKLTPQSPQIANQMTALDKKFGVTYFHDQRKAIVDKYGLKD